MKKITFIGGVGAPNEFGGELLKNKNILRQMRDVGYSINVIDTYKSHHSLYRRVKVITKIFAALLFRTNNVFVLSSSLQNVYGLIKLMRTMPFHYDIVNWAIGCSFNKMSEAGTIKLNDIMHIRMHIVEADGMKQKLEKALNIKNIKVLYNFRNLNHLPAINKFDDGKVHFLFFSRISPLKGVADIFSALLYLDSNGYLGKYCVDFYGDIEPSFKEEFDRFLSIRSNLSFCGTLQLRIWDNYSILARYHYMLFPTFWPGEGFPGAIIDSYIAGVPVLASDWAYVPEFITEGVTGRIYPSHNVEALISVMKEAIDGKMDCLQMSRNCQNRAAQFDTKYVLNEAVLSEMINGE
jgi:glycosyltransferase involved in cell wall biosynthesis